MVKFYLSKSVKSEFITLDDITIGLNSLKLSTSDDEKVDIYTFPMSSFRDSLWIKKGICGLGTFEDSDGIKGLVAYNNLSIDFYYPDEKGIQILENKNGLMFINFTNLKTKAFIDSKKLATYNSIMQNVSMLNIEYVADNGVIFSVKNELYSLIF